MSNVPARGKLHMTPRTNRQVLLARRPAKAPKPADFAIRDGAVPSPGDGQLVQNSFLSLDAYMRGKRKDEPDAYAAPFPLNEPLGGATVGAVLESRHEQSGSLEFYTQPNYDHHGTRFCSK